MPSGLKQAQTAVRNLPPESEMRIDQSTAAPRCDLSDDGSAAQESFDLHLQAARDRHADGQARVANDNANDVTVKRGDTLWGIAHRRTTTLKDLYEANPQFDPRRQDGVLHLDRPSRGGWDPDYIRPGDQIRLPSRPPLQRHPSDHPHQPSDAGCPGDPDRTGPTQNTPKPPDHSADPNSSSSPHNPNSAGTPNAQATPNASTGPNTTTPPNVQNTPNTPSPSYPSNPSNPSNPNGAPNDSGRQHGLTPIVPIVPGSRVLKGGFGIEVAGKAKAKPTLGGEPYVKGSLAIGRIGTSTGSSNIRHAAS
jgi:hypothetical protein